MMEHSRGYIRWFDPQKGYGEVIDAHTGKGFYLPAAALIPLQCESIAAQTPVVYELGTRAGVTHVSAIFLGVP
jgi:cold shock CspA family protein